MANELDVRFRASCKLTVKKYKLIDEQSEDFDLVTTEVKVGSLDGILVIHELDLENKVFTIYEANKIDG